MGRTMGVTRREEEEKKDKKISGSEREREGEMDRKTVEIKEHQIWE